MLLIRVVAMLTIAAVLAWATEALRPAGARPGIDYGTTASIPDLPENEMAASETLKAALEALDAGDLDRMRKMRARLVPGSLEARTLTWAIGRSGKPGLVPFEIETAMRQLKGWPGMERIRANYEAALSKDWTTPDQLIEAYEDSDPETLSGAISLARAHMQLGNEEAARQALIPWWHDRAIDGSTELLILSQFADVLTKEDHRKRFLSMMYRDRIRSADRVAGLAGTQSWVDPWAAAIRNESNALKALDNASADFKKTPHHLFARIHYLRGRERDEEAAKLLLESPVESDLLVDPDAWWTERRIISRDAFEHGDGETAYKIAAMQNGGTVETQVEAAFHAGWYALRGMDDPDEAIAHFEKIEKLATGGISRSRGAYWLGRANDAAGNNDAAEEQYRRAAQYPTTYYGQLALQRLARELSVPEEPKVTREDMTSFGQNETVAAMRVLDAIGQRDLAMDLATGLGRTLDDSSGIAQLVAYLEKRDQPSLALRMAKSANWRGIETGVLTHPVGAIPEAAPIAAEERPLAYAVARQESEFNISARSGANARGLMQLLPSTARETARRSGLEYDPDALLRDGGYNAALGTAYLRDQIDRFDGSYILAFIAYNAGPSRAAEWIERFGDPRGKPLPEVIDWVEQIPFSETRHYVQRVMENLQVYKARLGLETDIENDLRFGRDG